MAHHSDTTLSEPPLSPFSTRSLLSDGAQTSDEPADLGAFNSVFRVLNQLQLQQQQTIDLTSQPRSDSRATISNSESESEVGGSSTVWSQHPIASYLNRDDSNESAHSHSTPEVLSEEEEEDEDAGSDSSGTEGLLEDDTEVDGVSPSLGYLDSALGFLAAEKAKLAVAHLDGRNGNNSSTGESAWRQTVEPKRKRRRKRKGSSTLARMIEQDEDMMRTTTVVPTPEESSSSPELPSVLDKGDRNESHHRDAPASAKRRRSRSRHRSSQSQTRTQSQQRLYIPSSAPIPIPHSLPTPPDARIVRLRALANKLRHDFPQNSSRLAHILAADFPQNDMIDPRGPEPQPGDALTHVFIDHSNILIGFLNNAKRSRRTPPGKLLMSFAALALILERGRPISRRVLATSSPLYQNVDIAEDLGYSVHVYVRVPDFSGDGANGSNGNTNSNSPLGGTTLNTRGLKTRSKPPVVQTSSLPVRPSTESDPGQLPSPSNTRSSARPYSHSRSISATTASTSPSSTSTLAAANGNGNGNVVVPGRIRYREQGVDELLQLKLHQALVSPDADPPPTGATIVLATGDGASGQFNEDGFVGVVRTALNKGWMVELYAWGGGLSGAWRKVAEEAGRGRLKIWEMDPYVSDLLEVGGGTP